MRRMIAAIPGVHFVSSLLFGSSDPSNEVKCSTTASLDNLPEFKASPSIRLSPVDEKLVEQLKKKAELVKENATLLRTSYQSLEKFYSKEKLFLNAKAIAYKQERKIWDLEWNVENFPKSFFDKIARTYVLLISDAKAIIDYAAWEQLEVHKKIQAAKTDLGIAIVAAASQFHAHCNLIYQKATDKSLAVAQLLPICDVFANYAHITFDGRTSTFLFAVKSPPAPSLREMLEVMNQSIRLVSQAITTKPALGMQIKAQLEVALGLIQEAFKSLPVLNDKIIFSRKGMASSISARDAKDVEADQQTCDKRASYRLICEDPDYVDFKSHEELALDTKILTKVLVELKNSYEIEHKKIEDALNAYVEKVAAEVKVVTENLLKASEKLEIELLKRETSPDGYKAYIHFKNAQADIEQLSNKINRQKTLFHNDYETLKDKFGGKAIEEERKEAMGTIAELQRPFARPLERVNDLEGEEVYQAKFVELEKEKILKDILKILKKDTCSDKNIKDNWSDHIYTYMGKGGTPVQIQDDKKIRSVKVPHVIAFIKTTLSGLSEDAIDAMDIVSVKKIFKDIQKKINERQAKRSNVFVWCSCFGIESKVRKDPVIHTYQRFKMLDVNNVKVTDVEQFTYENITKAIPRTPIVPIRARLKG